MTPKIEKTTISFKRDLVERSNPAHLKEDRKIIPKFAELAALGLYYFFSGGVTFSDA